MMELSVEGVDVPEDAVLDDGVIVAALSLGANLPLILGWPIQELLGARVLVGAGDEVVDNEGNTREARAGFGDYRPADVDVVTLGGVTLTLTGDNGFKTVIRGRFQKEAVRVKERISLSSPGGKGVSASGSVNAW
jgi:hypothetical protein